MKLMPSLEWQKQNLETNIREKIDRVLQSVIKENQYNLDVEVLTKSQPEPQFYDSQKKNKPLGNLSTVGDVTKSDAAKKKQDELDNADSDAVNSKALIKFDDVNPTEDMGDVVTFTKFGIQAPLVDDFKDFSPDGKIVLTMQNEGDAGKIEKMKESFAKKEKELQDKLKQIQNESNISPVEQMWKYNNSVDVFKNLKAVNVTIRLSSALNVEIKEAVKTYVRAIKFNLGKVVPNVTFETALLGADTLVKTKEDKIKEALNYFGKFSTLFGILLGIMLLGFIGKSLINKFFELSAAQSNAQTIKLEGQQDQNKDEDESSPEGATALGGGGDGAAGELSDEFCGVERFKSYSKSSVKDAALLVKGWLSDGTKQTESALRALVQQLENTDLTEVFGTLTDRERNEWKDLLNKPLSTAELASANKFISNEVVQRIIIPNVISDPETFDLIVRIRPEQVTELIEKKPEISSVLLNVLNTSFLNKVLSHCDEETRDKIVDSAFEIREEDIISSQENLKESLKEYVSSFDKIPFIDKVVTILPDASLEIEQSLYMKLYQNTSVRRVKEIAMQSFPSFLIESFNENVLKAFLSEYSLEDKVKMLLTIDTEVKNKFMEIYAPSGSKANDLLTLEFENYEKDERELEKLMGDKEEHWKKFVGFVRKKIIKDKEILNSAEDVIDTWTSSLESSTDNVEELRAA
jgi:hypothetical protein